MQDKVLCPHPHHHYTYTTMHRERVRSLRKNLTLAEKKLWFILRKKQLAAFRFRRQVPIGNYIVDFACHSVKVIVEADGGQHDEPEQRAYDKRRTQWLEKQGYQVLRFWNNEILSGRKVGERVDSLEAVLEIILKSCLSRAVLV